ncbi:hypothetical protein GCM10010349_51480 [Streptomyces flavofungini]|uniref:Uncharacterized protein n=2 Tax=Streptomyces flavofungini TaxID=68200 RepID=A0ABS0XGU4_9ACTN|nr:hypothetical protein [Streptomyces flavofungini]GHC73589.1 hypothetical protein GCM10010349_51480 [Streptomyces flavofungini]
MAFGAQELRVLRRALAHALHPSTVRALDDQAVQDCVRLADDIDEAVREGARLRAFLVADLARYRAALPGTAAGYLELLEDVLATGYRPGADDLAALRALRGNPHAAALLDRCRTLAEQGVRARLAAATEATATAAAATANGWAETAALAPRPTIPPSRTRLLALPGGLTAADEKKPAPRPDPPAEPPAAPQERPRPVPTPAEVFPPKRPAPPAAPSQRLAAG